MEVQGPSSPETERTTKKKMVKKITGASTKIANGMSDSLLSNILYPHGMSANNRRKNQLIENYMNACCPEGNFPRRVREISFNDCDGNAHTIQCAEFDPGSDSIPSEVQDIQGPGVDQRACKEATDAYVEFMSNSSNSVRRPSGKIGSSSGSKKRSFKNRKRRGKGKNGRRFSSKSRGKSRQVAGRRGQSNNINRSEREEIINGLKAWCTSGGDSNVSPEEVNEINFSQLLSSGELDESTQAGAYYPCEYMHAIISQFSGSSNKCEDPLGINAIRGGLFKDYWS